MVSSTLCPAVHISGLIITSDWAMGPKEKMTGTKERGSLGVSLEPVGRHDSFLAARRNGACSSRQILSNSPQTYTDSGRDGGKKIPLNVFCLLRIFRLWLDGGGG